MKSSIELKELRNDIISELEVIKETATAEERDLTSDENNNMDTLLNKADDLSAKIKRAEKVETEIRNNVKLAGTPVQKVNTEKTTRGWSLFKAINEVRNGGSLSGLEAEMHQEAVNENRGVGIEGIGMPSFMTEKRAYVDQGGSAIAPSATTAFADALVEDAIYTRVGLTDLGNFGANQVVPITGANAVAWDGENANGTDTSTDFSKITLTPNRINGYANVSNVILAQNSGAEAAIMADMGRQISAKIDANMWASSDAAAGPGSIAGTAGVLTFTEAAAADVAGDLLEAIQTLADDHGLAGNLGFVNSYELYSAIRKDALVASTSALYSDDKIAGYNSFFSSAPANVAGTSGDGLFGDFSRIYFASFGPTSILVDPYSAATNNAVRLVVNRHYDWGLADGASFVKYTSLV